MTPGLRLCSSLVSGSEMKLENLVFEVSDVEIGIEGGKGGQSAICVLSDLMIAVGQKGMRRFGRQKCRNYLFVVRVCVCVYVCVCFWGGGALEGEICGE